MDQEHMGLPALICDTFYHFLTTLPHLREIQNTNLIDHQKFPDNWVDLRGVVVVLRRVSWIPLVAAKVSLDLLVVPPESLELLMVFQVVRPLEPPAASPVGKVLDARLPDGKI